MTDDFGSYVDREVEEGRAKPPGGRPAHLAYKAWLTVMRAKYEERRQAEVDAEIARRDAERAAVVTAVGEV